MILLFLRTMSLWEGIFVRCLFFFIAIRRIHWKCRKYNWDHLKTIIGNVELSAGSSCFSCASNFFNFEYTLQSQKATTLTSLDRTITGLKTRASVGLTVTRFVFVGSEASSIERQNHFASCLYVSAANPTLSECFKCCCMFFVPSLAFLGSSGHSDITHR